MANTADSIISSNNSANDDSDSDQLFFVTSYSDFDKLAHGPRGTKATKSLYIYKFNASDGSLVLLNVQGDPKVVINPAFSRYHPRMNVVYTCTENCEENGKIFAYKLSRHGELEQLGEPVDAGGTSTCYLTIDRAQKNMLAVNYWNSTLVSIPISKETGAFTGPIQSVYDPKGGKEMVVPVKTKSGVNHSNNDESTIKARQADPHSHALVLDPYVGTIAYVPDLGKDVIREFFYNTAQASIQMEMNVLPSGLCTGMADGPRYLEFHPKYNIAYVVNELSSTVAVFEVDVKLLREIAAASKRNENMETFKGRSTLRLVQSISTLPSAFPTEMNTCGRITVHKSGRFVVVSNRGHQSIAIFRVNTSKSSSKRGELTAIGHFHTRGETPRHYQFDYSGQYLIVANQDTDNIAIFTFNLSSGEIKFTGNQYRVPSPNFICNCPIQQEDNDDDDDEEEQQVEPSKDTFPVDVVKTSIGTESDTESTIPKHPPPPPAAPAAVVVMDDEATKNEKLLAAELAKAHEEIEALKQQLLAMKTKG